MTVLLASLVVHVPPAAAQDAWWNGAWSERTYLTLDGSGIETDLTGFPLLVALNPARIDYGRTSPAGADLRFLAADQRTVLPHEIEAWAPGGTSYVWVWIPRVGARQATEIWLYYGNPQAADGQRAAAVWDGHRAVWHLEDASLTDATGNGFTGINAGTAGAPGRVGRARQFDGIDDAVRVAHAGRLGVDASTSFTLSAWVGLEAAASGWQGIVTSSRDAAPWYGLWISSTGRWVAGGPRNLSGTRIGTGWTHVAVVQDGAAGERRLYVNGALTRVGAAQSGAGSGDLLIGAAGGVDEHLRGVVDEVRLDAAARSADWIAAMYRSESDGLLAFGGGAPAETSLPEPDDGDTGGSEAPAVTAQPDSFSTPHDTFPNFVRQPTIVTRQSGSWSARSTWAQNRIPGAGDVVLVAAGHRVTYDRASDASLAALGVAGSLRFLTDASTRLKVGTLFVQPGGYLEIGTAAMPVPAGVTADIIIADRPLYTVSPDPETGVVDPKQYGTGLIVLGAISIHGQAKTPAWTRLTNEPLAGTRQLRLAEPVSGWRAGDLLVVPDTRQLPIEDARDRDLVTQYETEVVQVGSISSDGVTVTLTTPLRFDHLGARNPDGTVATLDTGERLRPHVGNLTRNVRIRSDNPDGTRGHVMFTDKARVNVHNAAWIDLGRTTTDNLDSTDLDDSGHVIHIGTNQMARYWVHFHFLTGPSRPTAPAGMTPAQIRAWLDRYGWQYEFIGNAITTSTGYPHTFKWGIDVHASHFGRVTDNLIHNLAGSGLQTENGSESYNLLARNLVVKVRGIGEKRPEVPTRDPDVTLNHGRDGSGFWYRGPHNWMEGNVAADVTYAGHYISRYYLPAARNIPLVPGADEDGEETYLRIVPLLSFAGNEAYGPMEIGLYGAWVSRSGDAQGWPEIRIDRFVAWHPYSKHVEWYHNGRTTFSRLFLRGDPIVSNGVSLTGGDIRTVGMRLPHYENVDLTIDRADIRGLPRGIDLPTRTLGTVTRLQNSFLENYVNVSILTKITNTNAEIANVRFAPFGAGAKRLSGFYNEYRLRLYSGPLDIALERDDRKFNSRATYDVRVYDFDALRGDSFRLFDLSDPAPCRTRRPGISAFVCR